jgi:hypothetical protein
MLMYAGGVGGGCSERANALQYFAQSSLARSSGSFSPLERERERETKEKDRERHAQPG